MGAIDDATGEVLPGAHFTEQESTAGYLRVLRDILRERGIPHTVYRDRHSSLKRNDKLWTLEEELAGKQAPTQVDNKRFAVAPQDTQPAWRKAPTDHTKRLDLCALHYVRKVYKNHTVRLDGRVIDSVVQNTRREHPRTPANTRDTREHPRTPANTREHPRHPRHTISRNVSAVNKSK
jgi:hypothetical protein